MENKNIEEFIEFVLANKSNIQQKYLLGNLTESEVENIEKQTGINLSDYSRVIENFGIYHAIKHHGSQKTEQQRGQIAVNKTDFEKIEEIVKNPDSVKALGKSKRGGEVLQYIKKNRQCLFL